MNKPLHDYDEYVRLYNEQKSFFPTSGLTFNDREILSIIKPFLAENKLSLGSFITYSAYKAGLLDESLIKAICSINGKYNPRHPFFKKHLAEKTFTYEYLKPFLEEMERDHHRDYFQSGKSSGRLSFSIQKTVYEAILEGISYSNTYVSLSHFVKASLNYYQVYPQFLVNEGRLDSYHKKVHATERQETSTRTNKIRTILFTPLEFELLKNLERHALFYSKKLTASTLIKMQLAYSDLILKPVTYDALLSAFREAVDSYDPSLNYPNTDSTFYYWQSKASNYAKLVPLSISLPELVHYQLSALQAFRSDEQGRHISMVAILRELALIPLRIYPNEIVVCAIEETHRSPGQRH